jgi:catechol 2,3-dioxygenase-like lactoylglutathione lyase family enzyme
VTSHEGHGGNCRRFVRRHDEKGEWFVITRISHAGFIVKDLERSLHFYCQVLGFKRLYELSGKAAGVSFTAVYLQISRDQFLELFPGGTTESPWNMQTIGYSHLCLEVDNLDESVELIKANGIPFLVPPCIGQDRTRLFWVQDPDGNKIEFMQFQPDSMQVQFSQF